MPSDNDRFVYKVRLRTDVKLNPTARAEVQAMIDEAIDRAIDRVFTRLRRALVRALTRPGKGEG